MDTVEKIKNQISTNKVMVYIKGTPDFPMCGFTARLLQILKNHNANFAFCNVLENQDIRVELPKYANWPTFPQLYVEGELVGGSDIVIEMEEKGELLPLLQQAEALSDGKPEHTAA